CIELGAVDRLLQIHAVMDMVQEKLGGPLILAVAARRAESHRRLAVPERQGRRQRAARPLAGREARRALLVEPGYLQPRAEAEAERRDHRRGLQPAAARRRRDHVAPAVDDVEMAGVAGD